MICYLPFTHITANPFEYVAQALGPITVYSPGASLASKSMRQWQQQGLLKFCTPSGLDQNRLLSLFREHKAWARLHDGHIGDMVPFFSARQGRPPMVDETAPFQITTQIRHLGEEDTDDEAGALVQAALFLALAQEYDQHQERLCSDLETVAGMEQTMFATIGGGQDIPGAAQDDIPRSGGVPCPEDLGGYMTEQRLKSWARLAFSDTCHDRIYVTPSAAVFEHLKGRMADAVELPNWYIDRHPSNPDLIQQRCQVLEALCSTADFEGLQLDEETCGRPGDDALVLEWIGSAGFSLQDLLPEISTPDHCNNTIVGLVQPSIK